MKTANSTSEVVGQEVDMAKSEQDFRALAESMPQIVWATRPDGWNTYFNQKWVDYTGLTMEESHGHGWSTPFHPDDQKRAWDAWQQATRHGATYSLEVRLRRADGVYRWWLVRGVPQRDAAGKVTQWFGTCTDIHDLKLAEEENRRLNAELEQRIRDRTRELQVSEARHLHLFETTWSGVVYQDATGKIISMNPAAMRILGRKPEDFVGKTSEDLEHHTLREDGSPFPGQEHPSMVALRTGHEVRDTVMGVYNSREQAYRWININAMPLFRPGGAGPAQVYAMFEDITERKRVEGEVRNSESMLRAILASLRPHIAVLDREGTVIAANPAWKHFAEANGNPPAHLVAEGANYLAVCDRAGGATLPEAAQAREGIQRVINGEIPEFTLEYRCDSPEAKRWFVMTVTPLPRAGGGAVVAHLDITDRKRAEEALRESAETFRTVTESLPQLVWTCLPDGRCDYLGVQWCAYTGIPEQDQLGFGWAKQVHPDDRGHATVEWQKASAAGTSFDVEFRVRRHDGVYRWFKTRAVPLRDPSGHIVKWFGTNTDIEDLRRAELAARENESLAHLATEATEMGIWKWNLRTNRVEWDQQMFRIYGLPMADGILNYEDWRQAVLPEDLPRQDELSNEALRRKGQSIREFRIRRRNDGEVRIIRAVDVTRLNESGEVEWFVGTNQDITERRKTEEKMAWLASFPERNPNPVVELDLTTGAVLYANPASRRLFPDAETKGLQHPLLTGVSDLVETLIASEGRMLRREVTKGQNGYSQTLTYLSESHRLRVYNTDITDRQRVEEALRNSERLYRAIGESINYGIWICTPDGRNIYASESFLKLVGITQDQCSNFGWGDILHPDDSERTIAAWKECVRTGSNWDIEHRFRGLDGKWHPILARGVPVRDEQGNIIRWAGINLDISKLKETEETLRRSLMEVGNIRAALDEHAIVATTDPRGKITFVNDRFCAISQYAREELLGQDHRIINSGYHPKAFFRDLWTTITSGRVWRGEIKNRAKDGTFYWVDTTIVPFLDEHGKPTQFIAIRADISLRKQAEEALLQLNASLEQRVAERTAELERSNHDLEQFAYIASHDLQEPLRGVGGCVQILRNRYQGKLDARADELITHTVEGVTRMQALINDLLAYSRVGRQVSDSENVDAAKALEAALVNLRGAIRDTGAVIAHDELPSVTVSSVELVQLFQNLIGNALKYRARDRVPQIHVSARHAAGVWRFSVRDNGIGIEPQYFERIFGIFQRLHTIRSYPGTGIGLAICKRIVEAWGGRIGVESTPGQGSEFWFTASSRPRIAFTPNISTL